MDSTAPSSRISLCSWSFSIISSSSSPLLSLSSLLSLSLSFQMGLPPRVALLLILAVAMVWFIPGGNCYQRPKARETLTVPLADDADGSTPQQVRISMIGADKMRVTWITDEDVPSIVDYGTSSGSYPISAYGSSSSYSYILYKSGLIHEVVIGPLNPATVYYYRCSANSAREFTFKTPPAQLPIKFAVSGDLGQTGWTESTLKHIDNSGYDMLLLPGDLSYADFNQELWDSFGRLIEPLSSAQPWMVTQGNHEIEKMPLLHPQSFTAYNARWHMPYEESGSTSNLYYSFDTAGGSVHVIMLGSYTDFGSASDQYKWLESDIEKLNRQKTKWVVALIHAPWYNTNTAHQGEGEDMRKAMEELLYGGHIDVVFAGHVHAYERFTRVYNNNEDDCSPVHITIGDGGNKEGLATDFQSPQAIISLFREASFGHGVFEIVNVTHAHWSWHRNDNDESVIADQVWLISLSSGLTCKL